MFGEVMILLAYNNEYLQKIYPQNISTQQEKC